MNDTNRDEAKRLLWMAQQRQKEYLDALKQLEEYAGREIDSASLPELTIDEVLEEVNKDGVAAYHADRHADGKTVVMPNGLYATWTLEADYTGEIRPGRIWYLICSNCGEDIDDREKGCDCRNRVERSRR